MLDEIIARIKTREQWIQQPIAVTPSIQVLATLPGIDEILSIVIEREIGDVSRFPFFCGG
jgi:hypothetical protein